MKYLFSRYLAAIFALAAACFLVPATFAQETNSESLGVVKPTPTTEKTVIAVASFGNDGSAPTEFETMPRIIRRDLELSGFFKMPDDQRAANRQNLQDVANGNVDFEDWREMGVDHYLMANISQPREDVLRAFVLLYDIETGKNIISQNIDGSPSDVRGLAHTISDEVLRYLKGVEGFAHTQILFVNEKIPGIKEVAMLDADGFNQTQITRYSNICTGPVWGANGGEIYYTSYHGNRANIYGHMLRTGDVWTIAGYGGTNHSPAWNQKNKRVVMVLSKDGG